MKWRKLGSFMPEIPGFTHAALPTFHDGRVYFSPRDSENRSHVYFAQFDPRSLTFGVPIRLFGPGKLGSFDDSGVSVCQVNGQSVLYLGWNLGKTVPFRNTLASWNNNHRDIIRQRDTSAISISYGWYDKGRLFYHIISDWPMLNTTLIGEPGMILDSIMSRPCVLGDDMWYSYRAPDGQYRIGYAKLKAGAWAVMPSGIEPGGGFDSDAVAYPCVFDWEGRRYCLFNGNGYGKTGFGLAILEEQ